MVQCFVPQCIHRTDREGCKMFTFPRDPAKFKKWKKLVRRLDKEPVLSKSRVCACHFKNGSKENLPTIFAWSKDRWDKLLSPQKPKKMEDGRGASPAPANVNVMPASPARQILGTPPKAAGAQVLGTPPRVSPRAGATQAPQTPRASAALVPGSPLRRSPRVSANCVSGSPRKGSPVGAGLRSPRGSQAQSVKGRNETDKESRLSKTENVILQADVYYLKQEIETLKKKLSEKVKRFSISDIESDAAKVAHFTGLPNIQTFNLLLSLFEGVDLRYYLNWSVSVLTRREQLFLTLMKLRRNFSHMDLALRFAVSEGTVTNIVLTWLHALHEVIYQQLMARVPSRFKNQEVLPDSFQKYRNCRIVIDCSEMATVETELLSKKKKMFSNYKKRVTLKGLVGNAPHGVVTFVSKLYPGSTSDKEIVKDCGLVDMLTPGDMVMADKGSLISDCLPESVSVNIPPFKNAPQFTEEELQETGNIAKARIHVERCIERAKRYLILSYIPEQYTPFSSLIFQVCCALTNFMKPLIAVDGEEDIQVPPEAEDMGDG